MSATNAPSPIRGVPGGEFNCPLREVLDRIGDKWSVLVIAALGRGTHRFGDKWSVLVIAALGRGTHRFGDLQRSIDGGISQRMLTRTLRSLERDGLVVRTAHPVVPPRVDYDLTPLGRTLLGPVNMLADWATEHRPAIRANRRRYDSGRLPDS